jgi:hypothetical protein
MFRELGGEEEGQEKDADDADILSTQVLHTGTGTLSINTVLLTVQCTVFSCIGTVPLCRLCFKIYVKIICLNQFSRAIVAENVKKFMIPVR